MKKFLLFVLFVGGTVFAYFWYVRGINLLQRQDARALPSYDITARLPRKQETPSRPAPVADVGSYVWYGAASMPNPRTGVAVASIDSHVYVVGGVDGFDRTVTDVDIYDAKSDTWTNVQPLPHGVRESAIAAVNGKLYVIGGFEGLAETSLNTLYIYDPGKNQWSQGKSLPEALGGSAAVAVDGKIHVFGGRSLGTDVDTNWVYDPVTDTWSGDIQMGVGRERMDAVLVGRKVYLIGGRQGSLVYNLDAVDVYDLDRKTWDAAILMPRKRSDLAALEFQGKIYVFGGEAPTLTFGEIDVYDVAANRWSTMKQTMPHPRHGLGGTVVDGKFFLIGGGQRPGISVSDFNEVLAPPDVAPAKVPAAKP